MKRKIILASLMTLIALMLCGGALAEEVTIVASGTCGAQGDNLTWTLDSAGTLTIEGEGAMEVYFHDSYVPWYSESASITAAEIKDGVTSIGGYAFSSCSSLTSINIPDSVTSIGDHAFSSCISLTSVTIPDGVTSIDALAFYNCESLTSVNIPDSVISIGSWAFRACSSLTNITIPDGVTYIGDYAFYGCSSLTSISVGDGVTYIGDDAFCGCSSLTDITIPDGVTSIGDYAFCGCSSLTDITIPDGVTSIGDHAFFSCSSLTSVTIPDSVTSIGKEAFGNCYSLTSVTIGKGVTFIGDSAFDRCSNLKNLLFLGETLPDIGSSAFYKCNPTVYCYEFSEIDFWATEQGFDTVYIDNMDLSVPISLTLPADRTLAVGESLTVTAGLFPAQKEAEIIWTSSAPGVVSVEDGVLTALSVGEAEITASCGDASDSMTVTTFAAIGSFDLAESEIWIVSKTGAQLSVQNILPAGATGSFSYESSDTSVCTVSASGLISALKPGDATVTVAADSGVTRTCAVHVCYPVTAIAFEPAALDLLTGTTAQLTANVTARDQSFVNKLVSFSSNDKSVLTVDESGRVTAAAPGTATVTATAASGVSAECTVTVRNPEVILLPADLTVIEAEAFVSVDADMVVIPDGCASIGSRAFADCESLCLIEIPGSVTEIAADAFENCSGLTVSAPSGSPAEAFALAAGITFIAK